MAVCVKSSAQRRQPGCPQQPLRYIKLSGWHPNRGLANHRMKWIGADHKKRPWRLLVLRQ